jgi:hypothetical protein
MGCGESKITAPEIPRLEMEDFQSRFVVSCKCDIMSPVKECKNIMSAENLSIYHKACKKYFSQLREYNMPLGNPDEFLKFVQTLRIWIIHDVHYSKCEYRQACICTTQEAMQEWWLVLVKIREWNIHSHHAVIWRGSQVLRSEVVSRKSGTQEPMIPVQETMKPVSFIVPDNVNSDTDDEGRNNFTAPLLTVDPKKQIGMIPVKTSVHG